MAFIGTPHTKGAGYYVNNQALRNKDEADVRTCTHCQAVILMQQWKTDGGFCGRCMAPICGPCADRMLSHGCEPFIKQLERALDIRYKLSQFRKLAGIDAPPPGYTPALIVGGTNPRSTT